MSNDSNDTMMVETGTKVPVDLIALNELVEALNGYSYQLDELRITRSLDKLKKPGEKLNPFNQLENDYFAAVEKFKKDKAEKLWTFIAAKNFGVVMDKGLPCTYRVRDPNTPGRASRQFYESQAYARLGANLNQQLGGRFAGEAVVLLSITAGPEFERDRYADGMWMLKQDIAPQHIHPQVEFLANTLHASLVDEALAKNFDFVQWMVTHPVEFINLVDGALPEEVGLGHLEGPMGGLWDWRTAIQISLVKHRD